MFASFLSKNIILYKQSTSIPLRRRRDGEMILKPPSRFGSFRELVLINPKRRIYFEGMKKLFVTSLYSVGICHLENTRSRRKLYLRL